MESILRLGRAMEQRVLAHDDTLEWNSARPKAFLIVLADGFQFSRGGLRRFAHVVSKAQLPSGVRQDLVNRSTGMIGIEVSFTILIKAQYSFGSDHGSRSAANQSSSLASIAAAQISRAGDIRDALRQTLPG